MLYILASPYNRIEVPFSTYNHAEAFRHARAERTMYYSKLDPCTFTYLCVGQIRILVPPYLRAVKVEG